MPPAPPVKLAHTPCSSSDGLLLMRLPLTTPGSLPVASTGIREPLSVPSAFDVLAAGRVTLTTMPSVAAAGMLLAAALQSAAVALASSVACRTRVAAA